MPDQPCAVAAAHPGAVAAGLRALEEGGDACDAAVAVSLALGVAEPFYSGLGGGGVTLLWRADEKRARFIDFGNECARAARPGMFPCEEDGTHVGEDHSRGHRSILVPGLLRGLEAVHRDFGRLPWARLFEDAVQLAEGGVPVNWFYRFHQDNPRFEGLAESFSEFAGIHTDGGRPRGEGDLLRQLDLAATLRRIAGEGPGVFYEGEIAKAVCEEVKRGGGPLAESDMASYKIRTPDPLQASYRGLSYSTAPLPSSGLLMIQILNLMECLVPDMKASSETERVLALAKAMRAAFRDRFSVYGDPLHFDAPVEKLQSKAYAEEIARNGPMARPHGHDREPGSTTHFTIVDGKGNAVCHTQTLGMAWGSGIIVPGTGILLNNHTNWMDPRPGRGNSIGPGRRPMAGYSPAVILENGSPRLAIGSPGSYRIPTAVAQVIMNRFDLGMPLQAAVNAPRVHCDAGPLEAEGDTGPAWEETLRRADFEVVRRPFHDPYYGGVHVVEISPDGSLAAAADPRRGGTAGVR